MKIVYKDPKNIIKRYFTWITKANIQNDITKLKHLHFLYTDMKSCHQSTKL